MAHRFNSVNALSGTYWTPGTDYTVTVYQPGAVLKNTASGATTVTVHAGHGFSAGDRFFVDSTTTVTYTVGAVAEANGVHTLTSVAPALTASAGAVLTNVEGDTYSSNTIDWDGSTVNIYDNPAATTATTNSEVTTDSSTGEYSYYTSTEPVWEVVRDASGNFVRTVQGWGGFVVPKIRTFTSGDATPSVLHGNVFMTAGTTSITAFDDGIAGQIIHILAETDITIIDGPTIELNGSTSFTMAAEDTLTLLYDGTAWREIARNNMA